MTKPKTKSPRVTVGTAAQNADLARPAPKSRVGVKTPTKEQREFIEMERAAQADAKARAKAASAELESNEKTAPVADTPALDGLVTALLQRLAPALAAQQIINEPSKALADAATPVGSVGCATTPTSRYGTKAEAISATPIENELMAISTYTDQVHDLITTLFNALEPVLAYDMGDDELVDGAEPACLPNKESPLHGRLIARRDEISRVADRLRHMISRVRN